MSTAVAEERAQGSAEVGNARDLQWEVHPEFAKTVAEIDGELSPILGLVSVELQSLNEAALAGSTSLPSEIPSETGGSVEPMSVGDQPADNLHSGILSKAWAAGKLALSKLVALGTISATAAATIPNAMAQEGETPASGYQNTPYWIVEGLAGFFGIVLLYNLIMYWRHGDDHSQSWKERGQKW